PQAFRQRFASGDVRQRRLASSFPPYAWSPFGRDRPFHWPSHMAEFDFVRLPFVWISTDRLGWMRVGLRTGQNGVGLGHDRLRKSAGFSRDGVHMNRFEGRTRDHFSGFIIAHLVD